MRNPCLYLLLLAACCLAWLPSRAQRAAVAPLVPKATELQPVLGPRPPAAPNPPTVTYHPKPASLPDPLFLLNSMIIIDNGFLGIKPTDISKLYVYKGADAPRKWRSLSTHGIIDIVLKDASNAGPKTRTLAEIGQGLGLAGPVSYLINGMAVSDTDLHIAAQSIGEVKVMAAGETTLVDVQIIHRPPVPPAPDPSGKPRIMIRGTAAL
ncbi:hypothetical protein JAO73_14650 [Hymenobacter sp. BT523]|uniref:hypothetical protein n=1 Tax=Hymenobacter sp. BT523 TaxID=2795725 RepID=UPI0018EB8996|nr:hypothetical protein [Hymenobacter sp. BT523]MBJ6110260.1 hypothetical protein [Hymenobacter sp. BT523]